MQETHEEELSGTATILSHEAATLDESRDGSGTHEDGEQAEESNGIISQPAHREGLPGANASGQKGKTAPDIHAMETVMAIILYIGAMFLAVFATIIYLYSADTLLPSKYIPASLDIPCMSIFFLLAIILMALGRSIQLTEDGREEEHPLQEGVTDKLRILKESRIYDRRRINRLSELDITRKYGKRKKRGGNSR